MFVDKVKVSVKAGSGGNGVVSFRHEIYVDKGGPDGGDGGDGGDVVAVASANQDTLAKYRYNKQIAATSGQSGGKRKKHGKSGNDLEVPVPVGTVIVNDSGDMIADLTEDSQRAVIAKGGKGGFGNAHFTSSVRQAPRIAEKGEPGEQLTCTFELKMVADVGLVGLPNAGKSTLLATISNARPEIADYPFTTLSPNLGVVDVDGENSLLFADIPGLIAGASSGKGLGDEFLRHIERTMVLVHLIDVYNDDIVEAYKTIQTELHDYQLDLTKKPQIVVLSKCEGFDKKQLDGQTRILQKLVPKNTTVLCISAKSKQGIKELLREVQKVVSREKKRRAKIDQAAGGLPVLRLVVTDHAWQIVKQEDDYIVTGRKIERFAQRTDFASSEGKRRIRDIMRKMGIMRELERKGIAAGQKIKFGKNTIGELEY